MNRISAHVFVFIFKRTFILRSNYPLKKNWGSGGLEKHLSDANFCSRNAAAIQFSSIIWKFYFLATQALHCKYFKCIWLSCRKQLHGSLNEKYLKWNFSSIFCLAWKIKNSSKLSKWLIWFSLLIFYGYTVVIYWNSKNPDDGATFNFSRQ